MLTLIAAKAGGVRRGRRASAHLGSRRAEKAGSWEGPRARGPSSTTPHQLHVVFITRASYGPRLDGLAHGASRL